MELLLLIVIAGGVGLFLSTRQLASRLAAIERELALLRAGRVASTNDPIATPPVLARTADPVAARPARNILPTLFERVVAGRLLIWTGGIALAAGGVFLIRHSIELVTPAARMIAAGLLGLALIGAGEAARRGRLLSGDPRIAQALVGSGIAILYATAYGSHILFGLIGGGAAAALMIAITAAALALSLRHGAPAAALGLVGGFATPLLVGDPRAGALPVLAYLALLDAAVFALAWRRGWGWLSAAALAASFAWTGYFVFTEPRDALAAGLFAALLAIVVSLPRSAPRLVLLPPMIVALIETAVLVARSDIGAPAWTLFGAVAAVTIPLATIRPGLRLLPSAALLVALPLLALKLAVSEDALAPGACAVATLLFAGGLAPRAARSRAAALTACAALAGPLLVLRLIRPEHLDRAGYGMLAVLLAAAALGLLRLIRTGVPRIRSEQGAFAAAGTAALLAALGAHDLAAPDYVSAAWLAIATALLLAGIRLGDRALRVAGLALLTVTVCKVFLFDAAELEGVLRILSFLGLGAALIGIGLLYGKVLRPAGKDGAAPA